MYLSSISISEFRPYGNSFCLKTPGPGVTLLVGPNGLGKTALFDAVEWALTGQVARIVSLTPMDGRRKREYYGRVKAHRSGDFRCEVKLDFDAVEPASVTRQVQFALDASQILETSVKVVGAKSVAELLRSPKWSLPIDDGSLSNYLRSTHLLCQATRARFTGNQPKERWDLLSQLNGAELLTRAHARLTNSATMKAFGKELAGLQERLSHAVDQHNQWAQLVQRRNVLKNRTAQGGALDPEVVKQSLLELAGELDSLLGFSITPTSGISLDLQALLGDVPALYERAVRELASLRARLDSFANLPAQWGQGLIRSASAANAYQGAVSSQKEADDRLVQAQNRVDDGSSRLASSRALSGRYEHELMVLGKLVAALHDAVAAQSDLASLSERIAACDREIATQDSHVISISGTISRRRTLIERRESLEKRLQELNEVFRKMEVVEQENRRLPALEEALASRRQELGAIQAALEEKRSELRHSELGLQESRRRLVGTREQASAMSQSLAAIAALLDSEAETCPVCQTPMQYAELRSRALAAASATSTILVRAEEDVQARTSHVAALRRDLDGEISRLAALDQEVVAIQGDAASILQSEKEILLHRVFDAERPDEPLRFLRDQISATEEEARSVGEELERLPKVDALNAELLAVETLRSQAALDRMRAASLVEQVQVRVAAPNTIMTLHSDVLGGGVLPSLDDLERRKSDMSAVLARAREEVGSLQRQLEGLVVEVESCRVAAEHFRRETDSASSSLQSELQKHEGLLRQWRDLGLLGEPSESAWAAAVSGVVGKQAGIASGQARIRQLSDAFAVWNQSQDLLAVDSEVAEWLGREATASESELDGKLELEIQGLRRMIARCTAARSAVERMRELLKSVTEKYNEEVTAPLNDLERRYAAALTMKTPFSVTLNPRSRAGSTQLGLEGRLIADADTSDRGRLSAEHLLSEGQLALLR